MAGLFSTLRIVQIKIFITTTMDLKVLASIASFYISIQ